MVEIKNVGSEPVVLKVYGNKRSETTDSDGSLQQVPDIEMYTIAPGESHTTDRIPGLVKLYPESDAGEPWPNVPSYGDNGGE